MDKIEKVFHEEIPGLNESQPVVPRIAYDKAEKVRLQKYPSIMTKYNIKPTRSKIYDFRETIKEIVTKE